MSSDSSIGLDTLQGLVANYKKHTLILDTGSLCILSLKKQYNIVYTGSYRISYSGGSRGVSEVSGNWSAFPSGKTTNNTVKGSRRGHSYRHAHELVRTYAHALVTTFTMDIMF